MICFPASHFTDQEDVAYELRSDRDKMRFLPEEERKKIQEQVHEFRMEKARLDREMAKWDDSGNDIIVLSKQMCMIMMEMTDFTRYIVVPCSIKAIHNGP
jgi:catenin alpha